MAVGANMHMEFRVFEVADYKSDFKFNLWCYWVCLEVSMASDAIKKAVRGKMHIDVSAIEVSDIK